MTSKLYADATDDYMDLNDNAHELGETNTNTDADDASIGLSKNDQEPGKTYMNEVKNDQHAN